MSPETQDAETGYILGFSRAEQQRLVAQARTLAPSVIGGLDLPSRGELLDGTGRGMPGILLS